jgi:hypothetical protein
MAVYEILEQATKLYSVSDKLSALSRQNGEAAEALSLLATSVRQSATLLEVMVAVKFGADGDVENQSN